MNPATGLLLRLLGPLLEMICVIVLFTAPVDTVRVLGIPLRSVLYGGFVVGLLMVLAGLKLVKRVQPAKRPPRGQW